VRLYSQDQRKNAQELCAKVPKVLMVAIGKSLSNLNSLNFDSKAFLVKDNKIYLFLIIIECGRILQSKVGIFKGGLRDE